MVMLWAATRGWWKCGSSAGRVLRNRDVGVRPLIAQGAAFDGWSLAALLIVRTLERTTGNRAWPDAFGQPGAFGCEV